MSSDSNQDTISTLGNQAPPLPWLIIRREILDRYDLTQSYLARLIGISTVRISHLLNGRNRISSEVALLLGKVTKTDPAYWIDLQSRHDMSEKSRELHESLEKMMTVDTYVTYTSHLKDFWK